MGLYPVLAEAVKSQGLTFVGHVPLTLNPGDAAALGQRGIEHLMQVPLACSTEEAGLRRRLRALRTKATFMERLAGWGFWYRDLPHQYAVSDQIATTYDSVKAAALFKRFVDSGSWQTPTLFLERDRVGGNDDALVHADRPVDRGDEICKAFPDAGAGLDQQMMRIGKRILNRRSHLKLLRAMYRAGVGLLAGTDLPVGHAIPYDSLHEEMALMAESGLPLLRALQTATLNPARFFGLSRFARHVEVGKVANS